MPFLDKLPLPNLPMVHGVIKLHRLSGLTILYKRTLPLVYRYSKISPQPQPPTTLSSQIPIKQLCIVQLVQPLNWKVDLLTESRNYSLILFYSQVNLEVA